MAKRANLTSLVHSTNFTAKQLHFRVSENFTGKKRDNISAMNRFVISFCRYKELGLARIAFDRSNAMLALSGISKFSAKNVTVLTSSVCFTVYFSIFLLPIRLISFLKDAPRRYAVTLSATSSAVSFEKIKCCATSPAELSSDCLSPI